MDLYILRHAIAEVRSSKWRDDTKRPLSKKGVKKMREVATGMKRMGLKFDLILTSPFVRAKSTADIVADVFEKKVHCSEHLKSDADSKLLIQELNSEYQARERVLVVGHEPDLSKLISLLCSGSDKVTITLKKGGLCKLSVARLRHGRCASMEWLLTPEQLRGVTG